MPTKKKAARAAQMRAERAEAMHSDNDTDTAYPTDAAAAMPPPPARTNTELNLLVLRRYVPETERIISIAPFAVVYLFSPETKQWEKSGTEGTLFVCQLSGSQHPRYNVVILNRKSLDNFVTELVSEEDIEITEQYVILQVMSENGVPAIYGLWIFSDEGDGVHKTKDIVANAIQECAMRAAHNIFTTNGNSGEGCNDPLAFGIDGAGEDEIDDAQTPVQPPSAGQQVNLLSLFSQPSAPPEQTHRPSQPAMHSYQPQFSANADPDFFRSSHSPVGTSQGQVRPPASQNALLDLFKTAKTG